MKFIHRFSRSLTCKMTVADEPPPRSEANVRNVEWTGRPKPKHLREYIRWCHIVNSHLADLWKIRPLHVIQTGLTVWEVWQYRPGQAPKRAGHIETNPEATS